MSLLQIRFLFNPATPRINTLLTHWWDSSRQPESTRSSSHGPLPYLSFRSSCQRATKLVTLTIQLLLAEFEVYLKRPLNWKLRLLFFTSSACSRPWSADSAMCYPGCNPILILSRHLGLLPAGWACALGPAPRRSDSVCLGLSHQTHIFSKFLEFRM